MTVLVVQIVDVQVIRVELEHLPEHIDEQYNTVYCC